MYTMGGRSGAMGCVWGMLFDLQALLDVSRFYCLFGDASVSPYYIDKCLQMLSFQFFVCSLSIRVSF